MIAYAQEQLLIANKSLFNFNRLFASAYHRIGYFPKDVQDTLWNSLRRGTAILETEAQADRYISSYGQMHMAKLISAFDGMAVLKQLAPNHDVQVIDYGCGQGLASVVFMDYLASINVKPSISQISLIEPSAVCIQRATRNIQQAVASMDQVANIVILNKTLDHLQAQEIQTSAASIKFHLFSNILDIETFALHVLCEKISQSQSGVNYFVCVSPKFLENGYHIGNLRIDALQNYFITTHSAAVISARENPIARNKKVWSRYERIFQARL